MNDCKFISVPCGDRYITDNAKESRLHRQHPSHPLAFLLCSDIRFRSVIIMLAAQILILVSVAGSVLCGGATYNRTDSVVGNDWYNAFSFQAMADPTHGRV